MSLWNAVTDISFPPCRQQIELKCEDQIPVQRQPGCYPDRSTPRVRRVLFQPLICLRTITCLKLPVKNTVRSGSQQHKQAQQSWPFLQGQTTNSFVEIWRVLTTSNKNWTPHVCPGMWFATEVTLSPGPSSNSLTIQKAPTAVRKNRRLCPPSVHHSQISWEKKKKVLSSSCSPPEPEKMIQLAHTHRHLHTGCRHSHTQHTHAAHEQQGGAEGVHGLLRLQFLRWVIL